MLAVDTHVHLYDAFSVKTLADCVFAALPQHHTPLLCLVDRDGQDSFARLQAEPGVTCELLHTTLLRTVHEGRDLYWLAGKQVATAERLEVLALGTCASFTDGQPLAEALDSVRHSGALPVLPWSPGKWLGGRRKIIGRAIDGANGTDLALGDVAIRPSLLPEPFFHSAGKRGCAVLAGSDPLPLPGEEQQVMSAWSVVDHSLPEQDNTAFLRALRSPSGRGGRQNSLAQSIRRQLAYRNAAPTPGETSP